MLCVFERERENLEQNTTSWNVSENPRGFPLCELSNETGVPLILLIWAGKWVHSCLIYIHMEQSGKVTSLFITSPIIWLGTMWLPYPPQYWFNLLWPADSDNSRSDWSWLGVTFKWVTSLRNTGVTSFKVWGRKPVKLSGCVNLNGCSCLWVCWKHFD